MSNSKSNQQKNVYTTDGLPHSGTVVSTDDEGLTGLILLDEDDRKYEFSQPIGSIKVRENDRVVSVEVGPPGLLENPNAGGQGHGNEVSQGRPKLIIVHKGSDVPNPN